MKKIRKLCNEIIYSLKVSWESSNFIFVLSIFFECYQIISPLIIAYLFKSTTNIVVEMYKSTIFSFLPFFKSIGILIIVQIIGVATSMILEELREHHAGKMNYYITNMLLVKVNELDISHFDNPSYYNLIDKANRDSAAVSKLSTMSISLFRSIIQIISSGIILGTLSIYMPLILIVFMIPYALAQTKFVKLKIQYRDEKIENDRHIQQTSYVLKDRKYAQDIRIYHLQNYFLERYYKYWKIGFDKKTILVRKKIKIFSITKIIPYFATAGVLIFSLYKIVYGESTIGDFTYFQGVTAQFISGFNVLITALAQSKEGLEQMENFKKFMNVPPLLTIDGNRKITSIESIEFQNVSFTYPGTNKEVLKNISIKIDGDKIYSLVGRNGAGKTTFVKLLLRLYDPTSGKILINGIDLREIDINVYHKLLGVMFQEYNTYILPLRDNISLSDLSLKYSDKRLCTACENGEFNYKQTKYSKGFDTYIGKLFDKEGVLLSGGESQRLAIARTYFKENVQFYIMDEPNSALDPEAEKKVFDKLVNISKNRGVLFITHRMATVTIADEILVLDNGELVENGHHSDLLDSNGLYSQLYRIQANNYSK